MEQKNILNEMKEFQKDMPTKPDKNCNCKMSKGKLREWYKIWKTSTSQK